MRWGRRTRTAGEIVDGTLAVSEMFIDHPASDRHRVALSLRGLVTRSDGTTFDGMWSGPCLRYKVPRTGAVLPVEVEAHHPVVRSVDWPSVPVDPRPPLEAELRGTITRRVGNHSVITDTAELEPLLDRLRRDGDLSPTDWERLQYLLGGGSPAAGPTGPV